MPGPSPQRDPPLATGGHPTQPCEVRRRGERLKTTDMTGTNENKFNIMQWNAEGVSNKKEILAARLCQEDIDIACVQETHLNENRRFNMREYQFYRKDRLGRKKGGVVILVKNRIPAQ